MNNTIVSFKKACEASALKPNQDDITVKTTDEDLSYVLFAIKELFGYMSLPEHYHAAYTRFNQDIFEGVNKLVLGGLIYEGNNLVLEKTEFLSNNDIKNMGVRDIWITNTRPDDQSGCDAHSLTYLGEKPFVVMREEMKIILPKTHSVIMDCIKRLQSQRPIWKSAIKDLNCTVLRSKP